MTIFQDIAFLAAGPASERSRSANEARGSRIVMPLAALLVMPTKDATWRMEMELPFPPFPGLGIRVDVY
jgi:hypothetical protein